MSLLDVEAFARLDALGELLREQVRAIAQSSGYPLGVTGTGSLFSFHPHLRPVRDYRIARRSPAEAECAQRLHRALLARQVLLAPNGNGFLCSALQPSDLDCLFDALPPALEEAFA